MEKGRNPPAAMNERFDGLKLELEAELPEIGRMAEELEALGERLELPFEVVQQVTLVLDELLTNIISYGMEPGEKRPIVLAVERKGDVLHIELSDGGKPFDPTKTPPPDLDASLEDRKIGGLGIHFARTMMDSFEYRRDGDRNHVTLTKRIAAGEP
jgi:serine/threonine-protein kinase RsbW